MNETYYYSTLPPSVRTKLEAGAFASLRTHLQDRSDAVQNIDLMTLSGFCRNCLAKWLVVEARHLSADLKLKADASANNTNTCNANNNNAQLVQALDALGYDETAEHVYGCAYGEWKKRHAKKATDEQMDKYNASKPLHAAHDKELLAVKAEKPTGGGDGAAATAVLAAAAAASSSQPTAVAASPASGNTAKNPLLSDVCCEDVEGAAASAAVCRPTASSSKPAAVPPPSGDLIVNIGILAVSDRAAAGQYETGDLSGPAVEQSVKSLVESIHSSGSSGNISYNVMEKNIVPDDIDAIATKLKEWTSCDLIFTTGGTGFSPRDVTPEATRSVLDRESHGLMAYVSSECSEGQPLAALSRGTAGMRGNTLIVNLPGSPAGVCQTMSVLFPLLLHAVDDIKSA